MTISLQERYDVWLLLLDNTSNAPEAIFATIRML
jgi:hypothetical protein